MRDSFGGEGRVSVLVAIDPPVSGGRCRPVFPSAFSSIGFSQVIDAGSGYE